MKIPGLATFTEDVLSQLVAFEPLSSTPGPESVINPWLRSLNRTRASGIVSGLIGIEVVDQLSDAPKSPWHSGIRATSGIPPRPSPLAPEDSRHKVVSMLSS